MTEPTTHEVPPLRFCTLGPLRVERGDEAIPLGGRQQRAVLAVLLVHRPAILTVARIADELWGESVPAGHARTIQTYVHHLREVLEPDVGSRSGGRWDVLTTVNGGYQLVADDESVDAAMFGRVVGRAHDLRRSGDAEIARREYERALSMWRGAALFDLDDFPFASAYASRLEETRLSGVEGLIDCRLSLGEHDAVLAELGDLVAQYPLREKFHALYMLALYRSGRQADALAAYRALHQLLDDELGVEPSAEVRHLHQAILVQDPSIAAPMPDNSGPVVSVPVVSVPVVSVPVVSAPVADVDASPGLVAIPAPRSRRRRRTIAAAVSGLLLVSGGVVAFRAWHRPADSSPALPANSLVRIDPDGTVHTVVNLGMSPAALAYGDGTLWVTGQTSPVVIRVDPSSARVVDRIPVGNAPSAVTVTAHDAWVTNTMDGTVTRINVDDDTVTDTIAVGQSPSAIAAGESGIWVANSDDDSIQHIDPLNGRTRPPVAVGSYPNAIAVGRDALWVVNQDDHEAVKLDPASGRRIGGPVQVGPNPAAVTLTADAVWVADADSRSVVRLDPGTGALIERVLTGDGPMSVAAAGRKIWVGNGYDNTVSQIDPVTDRLERSYSLGVTPVAMDAVQSSVWIATGAATDSAHSGGTLVVAAPELPGSAIGIDPARSHTQANTYRALRLVYDGLVAYDYANQGLGLSVVPDLATTIPTARDGGLTYAFTVRSGVRFSDGTTVKASDIKRGLIRSLALGGAPPDRNYAFGLGIVGSENCTESVALCDLSRGVMVNDATGAVVIHLKAPDPSFMLKLAYVGQATGPSAPAESAAFPLPGTGPYRITQFTADDEHRTQTFVLTRNPYFQPWSFAVQPPGYPDAIRWLKTSDAANAVDAVDAGRADVTMFQEQSDPAVQAKAGQIWLLDYGRRQFYQSFGVKWMYLNTRLPPFNDVRVRRAFADAIDRWAFLDIGRIGSACQSLPDWVPGYQPYCPYQRRHGNLAPRPRLDEARALVAASGTRGVPITLTGYDDTAHRIVLNYLVGVLRSLRYQARANLISHAEYDGQAQGAAKRMQAFGFVGWTVEYPAASNIYDHAYSCDADPFNCTPTLDREALQAHAAEDTDPATARRLWADIDQKVTDAAAILPLGYSNEGSVTSRRARRYIDGNAIAGVLLSRVWVK